LNSRCPVGKPTTTLQKKAPGISRPFLEDDHAGEYKGLSIFGAWLQRHFATGFMAISEGAQPDLPATNKRRNNIKINDLRHAFEDAQGWPLADA
jgi:hypothetical protein